MTVPEIIANVLDKIRRDFYTVDGQVRVREFMRDQRQLMKAIATYGYECNERGWNFEPEFIHHELMELLLKIRTTGADMQYFPVYLAGAIRRHIGQRAEELSAKAKQIDHKVHAILGKLDQVGRTSQSAIREPKAVEILAEMYKGIKQIQRQRRREAHAAQVAKSSQAQLL